MTSPASESKPHLLAASGGATARLEAPALSIIVPVFNGAKTIGRLVGELEALPLAGQMEIVLVNDGSHDDSRAVCEALIAKARMPMRLIDLARNFGEHNAVMAGLRHARGEYLITMAQDLQNPPTEVQRLYEFTRDQGLDVTYTWFQRKQHAGWRNLGSWLANRTADLMLDKPRGLYLSSFRCLHRFVAREITQHQGPFPYIDGLVFQVTDRVGALEVEHLPSAAGRSNYTMRRLLRLWMSIFLNFSPIPLRLATVLGLSLSALGFVGVLAVLINYFLFDVSVRGWASLMVTALLFSGVQLLMLGVVGEYLGRMFLTVNGRPQAVVRRIVTTETETGRLPEEGQPDGGALDGGGAPMTASPKPAAPSPPLSRETET